MDETDNASAFRDIADKIKLNDHFGFGGAFVIVGPDGKAHSALLLDEEADPGMFWSLISTRVKIALDEIEEDQRKGRGGFGGMR